MAFPFARSAFGITLRLAVLFAAPALSLASVVLAAGESVPSPEVTQAEVEFDPVTDLDLY